MTEFSSGAMIALDLVVVFLLFCAGLYAIMAKTNIIKMLIGVIVLGKGARYLLLVLGLKGLHAFG